MPNLKAAFEADPELKAVCTSRDGRIYSLPKKLPLRPKVCGDVMCINQEWLDNLGLETPKTYKELEEVLVQNLRQKMLTAMAIRPTRSVSQMRQAADC